MRLAALAADLRDQRLELVGGAPGDAGDQALAREAARDRAAGRVAGADHENRFAGRIHVVRSRGRRTVADGATLGHPGKRFRTMSARVFISYRTSDGVDKATALSRDLDALFGEDQIFLDKDDLPAGSRWRDVIARTLHASPILLVLITPNYLDASDSAGKRSIERDDDPVRGELEAGLAAEAHVIPLLCDGVTIDSAGGRACRRRSASSRS